MSKVNQIRIATNFVLAEFMCPCCYKVMLDPILLKKLVALRQKIDRPIYINSGYRCKQYNDQVEGHKNSYHLFGMAVDIRVKDINISDLKIHAKLIGFKGIGVYSDFLHLDIRQNIFDWEGKS